MPSSQAQFFTASYDSATKILTAVLCAIVLVVAIATGSLIAAGVGVLILALSYAWSPRGYTVAERSIFVKRLIGDARLPLEGVREARPATADDFRGCIRLLGDGGLFGYYGLFRTSKLGNSSWYLTNRSNAAVVSTETKTALFSPDDREGFLAAIRASAVVPLAPPMDSVASHSTGVRRGALLGLAVALIVLAVVVLALTYSPGPPSYTLTPQSLTIHDRFYPVTLSAGNIAVDQVRVIDLDTDTQWRPTARTNGFANSHYRSGHFRVANGQIVRLYQAAGRRLVLLPPKGAGDPVLLETRSPDDFVAQLRREWSPGLRF